MLTAVGRLTASAESNVVSALGTMRKYLNQVRCPPKDRVTATVRSAEGPGQRRAVNGSPWRQQQGLDIQPVQNGDHRGLPAVATACLGTEAALSAWVLTVRQGQWPRWLRAHVVARVPFRTRMSADL